MGNLRYEYGCDTFTIRHAQTVQAGGVQYHGRDFPNEYRRICKISGNLDWVIPKGFTYIPGSFFIRYRNPPFSTYIDFQASNETVISGITNDTIRFFDNNWPYFDANGQVWVGNQENPNFYLRLVPNNCATSDTLASNTYFLYFDEEIYSYTNDTACMDTVPRVRYQYLSPKPARPYIDPGDAIQDGLQTETTWDIALCNIPDSTEATGPANLTWFALEPSSANILITAVHDLSTNLPLPILPYGPAGHVWVQTPGLAKDSCHQFRITARYGQCSTDSMARIHLRQGWACHQYPLNPNAANCPGPTTDLFLRYRNAGLQMQVHSADSLPFNFCDTLLYRVYLESSAWGRMYDVKFETELPPGVSVDAANAAYFYPIGGAPVPLGTPNMVNNRLRWALDSLVFWDAVQQMDTGFVGVTDTLRNRICLAIPLRFNCAFQPGDRVRMYASGVTNCGDAINIDPYVSPALFPQGFSPSGRVNVRVWSEAPFRCDNLRETIHVVVRNDGTTALDPSSMVWLNLPTSSYAFANGFNGIHWAPNHPTDFQSNSLSDFGWNLPATPPGDSTWFSFEIQPVGWLCDTFNLQAAVLEQLTIPCPDSTCALFGAVATTTYHDSLCCCKGLANCRHPDAYPLVDSLHCEGDSLIFSVRICNDGDTLLPPGMPIMIYAPDPTQSNSPIQLLPAPVYLPVGVFPGDCAAMDIRLENLSEEIYLVVNDEGLEPFPLDLGSEFGRNQIGECNFENNMVLGTVVCACDTAGIVPA
ncbi:MAG: hypothetical protein AAF570_12640, partial [Bacteroidota bacterium]